MAEAALQRGCIEVLKATPGAWFVKIHQTGRGRRGVPDLLIIFRGVCVVAELKTSAGMLRPEQTMELQKARVAGAVSVVIRQVSELRMLLSRIERRVVDLSVGEELSMELPLRGVVELDA